MRLSRIKLAGFKSFVDPTTFHLPSNLVGIVGPNGCGKSNVIDAVRWVMGEMSAKHLRGDSMADVIFNGSASRKPVGSASIELFFDNSDGSIGGQYAQYGEISLRRTLSRDGSSSYFLNNVRCRRKDITELFLGTGLGSRSYAIIEQGMVSRLVDAKPDEMRTYIEEAAGISKYKERRRETETRIQHTRENLARLHDVREEITKQIDYLQRQARAAERYKELKGRERRIEAELLAMRLSDIENALNHNRLELARRQTDLESCIANQRHVEAEIVNGRQLHISATEAFNRVQAEHYAVQSELSRLEQRITHAREIRERQSSDLLQARGQLSAMAAEIQRDRARLLELDEELANLRPSLVSAKEAESAAAESLRSAEDDLQRWQSEWHEFSLREKTLQQTVQLEQTRAEHLEAQMNQLRRQMEVLEIQLTQTQFAQLETQVRDHEALERDGAARLEVLKVRLQEIDTEIELVRQAEREASTDLERATTAFASAKAQLATLIEVQQAAFGSENETLMSWLAKAGLNDSPRLAQQLRVEKGWVLAVETVLGDFLQAFCIESGSFGNLVSFPDSQVALIEPAVVPIAPDPRSLLAKVSQPGQTWQFLANVLVADTLSDALRIRATLQQGQSVITPDGIWLGTGWTRINRGQRSVAGVLTRENQIRDLESTIATQDRRICVLEASRSEARQRLVELETARAEVAMTFNAANREHAEIATLLDGQRQEVVRTRDRREALQRDAVEVATELERLAAVLEQAKHQAAHALSELEAQSAARPGLQRQQDELLARLQVAKAATEEKRREVGQLTVHMESRRVSRDSVAASVERLENQHHQLLQRITDLEQQVQVAEPLLVSLQHELDCQLHQQLAVDSSLAARRQELEQIEAELHQAEARRTVAEKAVNAARDAAESIRIQVRELEVRREALLETLTATGAVLDDVLREMPQEASCAAWQESLDQIRRKIERLGPINLAAIEQFNEQSERKTYLDAQNDDLTAALETLEQAIRKIDKETRSRFQETFDSINQGLKRIFPRLFGGGHAYLSLDGDDILSAGVTVMARPPGKRNSHIHLLSGGEKALTAVALIFAIFELNPAPFCLLDEVDAPLDEANVARFCDIVNEMSQRVQFVVITHNKTTMEMTRQLIGVTMNEPGVSRLVSVDLDAAVRLAAS